MLSGTQITVFGGTGFIGRYVIDRLADQGAIIRVATRSKASAYFLRTAGAVGQVVPVSCDIHDTDSIRRTVQGSDIVINLVGILGEKGKKNTFCALHHEFPMRLAQIAAEENVTRLVHVSALGADKDSASVYACSKAEGEAAVLAAFPKASILRPSIVFGQEDRFFNFFAKIANISPFLPLIGGGNTLFQPIYVGDIAEAVMRCLMLSAEKVQGKIFELGGDTVYSFRELMEKMFSYTDNPRRLVSLPFSLAKPYAAILQCLPGKVLTVDQVRLLQQDNIVTDTLPTLADLGISAEPMEAVLPHYLRRFQPGGRFAPRSNGYRA